MIYQSSILAAVAISRDKGWEPVRKSISTLSFQTVMDFTKGMKLKA